MDTPASNLAASAGTTTRDGLRQLTVVIPVLNAGATLAATLEALPDVSVVVVDGGSADDSAAIAAQFGATVVASLPGRGTQLAAGANAAPGAWLLFLHGDTCLGPDWPAEVAMFMHDPRRRAKAAAFRFQLDDSGVMARVMARGVAWRCRRMGLPYGDQGLLIHRDLYEEVGGYRSLPLMEDVDLVRRIGRRRLVFLETPAVTSAARYRRDGYVIRATRNLLCLALYSLGVNVNVIRRVYGA